MPVEQRAAIGFLVAENVGPVDIHWRLLSAYGDETQSISSVCRRVLRIERSEVEKAIISDRRRCGRPVTVTRKQFDHRDYESFRIRPTIRI